MTDAKDVAREFLFGDLQSLSEFAQGKVDDLAALIERERLEAKIEGASKAWQLLQDEGSKKHPMPTTFLWAASIIDDYIEILRAQLAALDKPGSA